MTVLFGADSALRSSTITGFTTTVKKDRLICVRNVR